MYSRFILSALLLGSVIAGAAGFEKTTLMSGRYQGIAGAATSSVAGPESLYFNPAGLASTERKTVTLDVSPTQVNFKGPVASANTQESSSRVQVAPGLFYAQPLNDKFAIGVGYYAAGGNSAEYNNVQILSFLNKPNIYTRLEITEFALGAGYKINDKWKIGGAWRAGFVSLNQGAAAAASSTVLVAQEYRDLKGSNMLGYRLGVQYDDGDWGFGASYRNTMHVALNGKLFVRVENTGATENTIENDMSLKTQFPQQFALGAHKKFNDKWTGYFDYSWTNYSAIERLTYEGSYTAVLLGGTRNSLSGVYTGLSDQHIYRLAGQYGGYSMPIRFGYAYTSRVTSNNYANPTFAPPAPSHTFALGTGCEHGDWKFDGAVDYTMFKGSVATGESLPAPTGMTANTALAGDYTADVYALHLGATYAF